MRIVVTQQDPKGPWDQIRQVVLSLGLECGPGDCVGFADLPVRLARAATDLVLVLVGDDHAAALTALYDAGHHTKAPLLAAGKAASAAETRPLTSCGAAEYLDRDRLREDLPAAIEKLNQAGLLPGGGRGRMIAVTAALPGTGVTTVAASLAFALAEQRPFRVALAELGQGVPELSLALDLHPGHGLEELNANWERLDAAMLRQMLAAHAGGVHVLAHKAEALAVPPLDPPALRQLLVLLKAGYDHTVIDLGHPAATDAAALTLMDLVVIVVRLDVPSLRLSRRYLRRLTDLGVEKGRFRLVANRYGQRRQVGWKQAEEALGHPLMDGIPDDPATLNQAVNQGEPLIRSARRATITRSFARLAGALHG
jgi:pilus assembly protein CpaE